jgi:CheY-like chemotaxis protein
MMGAEKTVLIIEDEGIIRLLLKDILAKAGYAVLEGRDGAEGLEVFGSQQDQIGVVLLDLRMPNMSGYEALAEMQILDPDIKIIVITAFNPDEERLPGVKGILRKPIIPDNLLRAVQEAFEEA